MLSAWLVHLYTASGALLAFLAISFISQNRYRDGFFCLFLAVCVDATDGVLARGARVSSRLPWFDGGKLDEIVDYLTYVFVPAFIVWQGALVSTVMRTVVPGAMLLASAYGFVRKDAKTPDHFFTGFPSYWNIVVFYLYLARWPPIVNAILLLALAVLVFVPVRFVYPSRTPVVRSVTVALGIAWGAMVGVMLWQLPAVNGAIFWTSLAFPAYYVVLSLVLDARRRAAR